MELSFLFRKSALTLENRFNGIQEIRDWIYGHNLRNVVRIEKITFEELDQWYFSKESHNLRHKTGKFFSIDGLDVKTNWGEVSHWNQPIINQPEIGYLGIITKEINGVLHFLLQAKIEPGNVNCVQLSPTLQATKSNYTLVHEGKTPSYLEYFLKVKPDQILVDQLQSEQGSRFLRKRNRNMIIKIDEDIKLYDNFIWLTLAQIKLLMQQDNLINMDTRTVISCIPFSDCLRNSPSSDFKTRSDVTSLSSKFLKSFTSPDGSLHTFEELIQFITKRKCLYDLDVCKMPLNKLDKWIIDESAIRHIEDKYFRVIAAKVEIASREVVRWTQPMIETDQVGLCAFICKEINGTIHLVVQTKLEAGNFDILELAPTIQCLTGSYKTKQGYTDLPFLSYALTVDKKQIVYDTLQSEEGGRFYKEQNRNMLIIADDDFDLELPENYVWMTLSQIQMFIKFNNYLNIQARSLIAAISFL